MNYIKQVTYPLNPMKEECIKNGWLFDGRHEAQIIILLGED